jgi:predicted DNA binding protein
MTASNRVTEEDVLSVFRNVSDPKEALSTKEVSDALDCSRRTAYERLSELVGSDYLSTKKVGGQVRIWWAAPDLAHPRWATVNGELVSNHSSSQTIQLELQSEQMAQPYFTKGGSELHVTIEGIVSSGDQTQLQYWSISGISLSSYLEIIKNEPEAIGTRVLSSVDGTHRVEVHSTKDSLGAVINNHEGIPTGGTLINGTLSINVEFPETLNRNAFIEDASTVYSDIEIASQRILSTPELSRTLLKETLSDQQWTAMQLAYYAGYFDQPRKSTGEEIAERMGITRQTFNRHLRKAEQRLARFILEDLDETRFADFTKTS